MGGDLLTLVFGHLEPFAAANRTFELKLAEEDALFVGNKSIARALVVAPNLIPQTIAPSSTTTQQQEETAHEIWGENVQRIHRDFATPKTLAEPWFHKEKSYFTSARNEHFADCVQYFLESIDRFGGVHLFLDDSNFVEAVGAMETVADETCGTSLLKSKSVCFAWHNLEENVSREFPTAQSMCALAPLMATYAPIRSELNLVNAGDAIHTLSLPYRQHSNVEMAAYYFPVSSYPSTVSITNLRQDSSTLQHVWGKVESTTPLKSMLTLDLDSKHWLQKQSSHISTRQARDFSMQRLHLEQDEHMEMVSQLQTWVEDYDEL